MITPSGPGWKLFDVTSVPVTISGSTNEIEENSFGVANTGSISNTPTKFGSSTCSKSIRVPRNAEVWLVKVGQSGEGEIVWISSSPLYRRVIMKLP